MVDMTHDKSLAVFQDKKIRRIWHKEEWYFSVVDIVEALTESPTPRQYWGKIKDREFLEIQVSPFWVQLKLLAEDTKMRETDCVNTEGAFRLIQSIPSPKAEPFKLWLAKTGYERIQEIQNPELAQDRARKYYELKGYPKDWIEKRIRGIAIRQDLTDEWKARGISEEQEFAVLTDEISKATFGKTVAEYKQFKGLEQKNQNLRDHMTDLETIFTMLGEKATTEITKVQDSQGLAECKDSAQRGGAIANHAKTELEKELGKPVETKDNFLGLTVKKKIVQKKE